MEYRTKPLLRSAIRPPHPHGARHQAHSGVQHWPPSPHLHREFSTRPHSRVQHCALTQAAPLMGARHKPALAFSWEPGTSLPSPSHGSPAQACPRLLMEARHKPQPHLKSTALSLTPHEVQDQASSQECHPATASSRSTAPGSLRSTALAPISSPPHGVQH